MSPTPEVFSEAACLASADHARIGSEPRCLASPVACELTKAALRLHLLPHRLEHGVMRSRLVGNVCPQHGHKQAHNMTRVPDKGLFGEAQFTGKAIQLSVAHGANPYRTQIPSKPIPARCWEYRCKEVGALLVQNSIQ